MTEEENRFREFVSNEISDSYPALIDGAVLIAKMFDCYEKIRHFIEDNHPDSSDLVLFLGNMDPSIPKSFED